MILFFWLQNFLQAFKLLLIQKLKPTEKNLFWFHFKGYLVIIGIKQDCCCSVTQPCLTLCNLMDCSMAGFPVLHKLPELVQTHFHWVNDAIHTFHPLLPPSPPALILSQHQGLFQSWLFALHSQSTGTSASASACPVNFQGWFPLGYTGFISLLFKRLSRVFSSTTGWKHQSFSTQPSLWSKSHIHTWLLEKGQLWLYGPL